jgi:hypothetical protein
MNSNAHWKVIAMEGSRFFFHDLLKVVNANGGFNFEISHGLYNPLDD